MSSDPEARHQRMLFLLQENSRRRRRPQLLELLVSILGSEPSPDAFLSQESARELQDVVVDGVRRHQVWHRIWGNELRGEVARTLRELAEALEGHEAYLLIGAPLEAIRVPLPAVLRYEAEHLSPYTDFTLVSADKSSGILLEWDHMAHADENTLTTWGRFARDLSADQ